jgi:hypothetical protein
VTQHFAIEGLRVSVQPPDVTLSWPSNPDETYIVQWRPNLSPGTAWVTLATYFPAESATNWTTFVDSGRVQSGSYGMQSMTTVSGAEESPDASIDDVMRACAIEMGQPMVRKADGSGTWLPIGLYWPGFDLSAFIIMDPSTGVTMSGAGYIISQPSVEATQLNEVQTLDEEDDVDDPPPADPGFYQVVRTGVHLVGVTNGMTLSGVVAIPVEAGNPDGNLVYLTLTEDDSPISAAPTQRPPFPFPPQAVVDTTQMTNGVHQISARARWDSPGSSTDENGASYEADSPVVTVNVYNEISFPNWMPSFGEFDNYLYIEIQCAHTNANWYIDIYDSQSLYIGTFQGQTYDGSIQGVWNLMGPRNDSHYNDPFFTFVVTTDFGGASPAVAAPPPIYKVIDSWSGAGQWVMAVQHAWDGVLGHDELYGELDRWVQLAQDSTFSVSPPPDINGQAFTLHYDTTGQSTQPTTDWASFRSALYAQSSRNLIYCGHGTPDGLGHNAANPNRFISAAEIGQMLHTVPGGQANHHAYRMVILDGCSTGGGALIPAFGMIPRENLGFDYYYYASLRPSVFMGWASAKYIAFAGAGNVDHGTFIGNIAYQMANGFGIKDARNLAAGMPNVNQYYIHKDDFKVYGYADLSFWAFN